MYNIEKPVDTFIILFVLFIGAFVVIAIVANPGSDQVSRNQYSSMSIALQEDLLDAKSYCHDQCNDVISQGCSDKAVAEYCIEHYDAWLDFNLNGKQDYDDTFFHGLGVCEDSVYCPQLVDCFCGQKITLSSCTETLCRYYQQEQALDADSSSVLVEKVMDLGTCDAAATNWVTILKESGRFTCS